MEQKLGNYSIGLTIGDRHVLGRVQEYADDIASRLGVMRSFFREVHITVVPPFMTTSAEAAKLNLLCDTTTRKIGHTLTQTMLSIREVDTMQWGDEIIFHFPVRVVRDAFRGGVGDFVTVLHRSVEKLERFSWKGTPTRNFYPHITGVISPKRLISPYTEHVLEKSKKEEEVRFSPNHPSVYVRYPTLGWRTLAKSSSPI